LKPGEHAISPNASVMSLPARLWWIFVDPVRVALSMNSRPAWFGTLAVLTVLSLGVGHFILRSVGPENIAVQRLKASPGTVAKTEAELALAAPAMARRWTTLLYLGPVAVIWLGIPFAAGLLALLTAGLGVRISYRKLLAYLAHTTWVHAFATAVVIVAVTLLTVDPEALDAVDVERANLGYFLDGAARPVAYALASSLDLFSLWHLAILAAGISVLSHRQLGFMRALLPVLALWILYVAGKAAWVYARFT
jgi:hypothetical protein